MPALKLFGRRWLLAGDDLPLPGIFLAVFHGIWVIVLALWLRDATEMCPNGRREVGAVGSMLGIFVFSVLNEISLAFVSSKGSLFETRKRSSLAIFVYIEILLILFQCASNGYATHILYTQDDFCNKTHGDYMDLGKAYEAMIWSTWAVLAGCVSIAILAFNFFPDYSDPKCVNMNHLLSHTFFIWRKCAKMRCNFNLVCSMWKRQLVYISYWFCCITGPPEEISASFSRIGELIYLVLGHIDLALTDVIVMVYLCLNFQRYQRYMEEEGHPAVDLETQERRSLSAKSARELREKPSNIRESKSSPFLGVDQYISSSGNMVVRSEGPVEPQAIQEASHFMKFAFAAYGWMLFVWSHPKKDIREYCCGRACTLWCEIIKKKNGPLQVLKAKHLNRAAILRAAGLSQDDLLFVRHEDEVKNVLPYYIALDHEKKSVVIAIRGSLSFDDVVRDLKFDPVDVDEWLQMRHPWGAPSPQCMTIKTETQFAAHSGIMESALAIVEDIKKMNVLNDCLLGPEALHSKYRLVLCGHSLGAGCAFLVGVHLRCFFPTLKCMCFSPPGGLVSSGVAESSVSWCVSTVCGKEWIPRLTLNTIEFLRDDMIYLGITCKLSKLKIFLGWIMGKFWSEPDLYYPADDLPEEPKYWLKSYNESLLTTSGIRKVIDLADDFRPPGKIMYLKPTGRIKTGKRSLGVRQRQSREYQCVWVKSSSLLREGILLSGRMMKDHMPDYSFAVLKRLAASTSATMGHKVLVEDSAGDIFRESMMNEEGGQRIDPS